MMNGRFPRDRLYEICVLGSTAKCCRGNACERRFNPTDPMTNICVVRVGVRGWAIMNIAFDADNDDITSVWRDRSRFCRFFISHQSYAVVSTKVSVCSHHSPPDLHVHVLKCVYEQTNQSPVFIWYNPIKNGSFSNVRSLSLNQIAKKVRHSNGTNYATYTRGTSKRSIFIIRAHHLCPCGYSSDLHMLGDACVRASDYNMWA